MSNVLYQTWVAINGPSEIRDAIEREKNISSRNMRDMVLIDEFGLRCVDPHFNNSSHLGEFFRRRAVTANSHIRNWVQHNFIPFHKISAAEACADVQEYIAANIMLQDDDIERQIEELRPQYEQGGLDFSETEKTLRDCQKEKKLENVELLAVPLIRVIEAFDRSRFKNGGSLTLVEEWAIVNKQGEDIAHFWGAVAQLKSYGYWGQDGPGNSKLRLEKKQSIGGLIPAAIQKF